MIDQLILASSFLLSPNSPAPVDQLVPLVQESPLFVASEQGGQIGNSCDPLGDDCDSGEGCYWDGGGFSCLFADPGLSEGEPCGFINDCAGGLLCASAEVVPDCQGSACCAAFCDLNDPVCQLEGTECVEFFEEGNAPPGLEGVGLCGLP